MKQGHLRVFVAFFLFLLASTLLLVFTVQPAKASPETFGKTDVGSFHHDISANTKLACRFKAPENGNITKLSVYLGPLYWGAANGKAAIYADSSGDTGSLISEVGGQALSGSAWNDFDISGAITKDAYYWFTIKADNQVRTYRDDGATDQTRRKSETYGDDFSDPFGAANYKFAYEQSIYGTYTSSDMPPGGDITPPTYLNLAHNNTIAGQQTKFSCLWSDDVGLSGFIFSTNNTGAWVNSTWTSLSGTSGWSNVTQMLNSMAVVVQYRFYCNDTSNNWHKTTTRSFVVSSSVMSFPFDDNFDDNIMNSTKWVRFEKNNGTVSEANGRVEINVLDPPGAAGYITKTKYDLSYSDIRIDVSNEHLCEATLVITLDGLYDHFWYSNDFYSIEKHRYSNEILVKVRTNGGERIFLYNDTWTGPNGSLRIRIQEGRIYFYEEDNLIYSEAYRLDSYYGYIHFEADTWSNNYYGMDYFDNFSLTYLPPVSSSISIAVSPSIALVGFEVKILGQLTCQQNGTGISNAPLLVSYRYHPDLMSYIPSEKGWNIISTVTTDTHGGYSVTWFVMSSGYYVVEAFYPGFGNVQGASNFTNLLITSLDDKIFSVSSNSTVSAMNFDSTARELNFTVSGPSSTTGYLHMYLAKSLVSDLSELKIYFDGLEQSYEAISVGNRWFVRLIYSHSSHCIRICLGPDMPATTQTSFVLLVLLLTVLATMAIIVLILKYRKIDVSSHKQKEHKSCLV